MQNFLNGPRLMQFFFVWDLVFNWKVLETYIFGQGWNPAREPERVRLKPATTITLMRQPAVVNVDVGVAYVFVAVADNQVSHLFEQSFTDAVVRIIETVCIASESFPSQPTHRRRSGQAILQAIGPPDQEGPE